MSKTYHIFFFEDLPATANEIVACFHAPPKRPSDPEFEVVHYECAADAIRAIEGAGSTRAPDLALLDLSEEDYFDAGIDICRLLVETWPSVPVVFLSHHDDIEKKTAGLKAGAINYVSKKVLDEANYREYLRAQVARIIRSVNPDPPARGIYRTGNLVVNLDNVEASWRNQRLKLMGTDFHMLDDLARPENRTSLRTYRTYKELHEAADRAALNDVHRDQNVRKRIQIIRAAFSRVDPEFYAAWNANRHGILTVSGRGYRWVPDSP